MILVGAGNLTQFLERGGAADASVVGSFLGQGLEQLPGEALFLFGRCLGVCLVGVSGEGFVHAAGGFVVAEVERFVFVVVRQPAIPSAHEGVLHDGQLVGVVTKVVEQPLNQAGGNIAAAHADRAFNGGFFVLTVEARD